MRDDQKARLWRDRPAMFGLGLVALLVAFALVGPWLCGDPNASDFGRGPGGIAGPPGPSAAHPLGTDPLYRDLLARLAHGARLSLAIGVTATALALFIGTLVGVLAGHYETTRYRLPARGLIKATDVALAFPYLLLITAIGVALDQQSPLTVTLVLGATGWVGVARVVHAKVQQLHCFDYIAAARALGAGDARIIVRHVLPALRGTLLVIGSHAVAQMILAEAVLGYLGVGVAPPQATWGRMLHEAEHFLGVRPLLVAAPGFAILLAVLGFTRLGDGLREALEARGVEPPSRSRVPVDVALLAVTLVLLVGFREPDPLAPPAAVAPSAPRSGGVLRLATSVAVHGLDPALTYDEASRAVNDLLFARLLTWDEQGRLVGELAEHFEVQSRGKRVVFRLRPGLTFHDGTPLVAADVKRSLERTLSPKTPCPAASAYSHIQGFAAYRGGKARSLSGIAVDGPLELSIQLDSAHAPFLSLMALGFAAPVCSRSGPIADPSSPAPPCGAGPFKLARFEPGQRVEVARFERYYAPGRPYLDGVVWELSVPSRSQRSRFERGELDLVSELTGIDAARFEADERWRAQRRWFAQPATHGIFLNTEMPPFDNRHLRRAVALAVDASVLPKVRASIAPADRVLPPAIPGPPRDTPMRRHDLEAALREMRLGGYPYDPATRSGGYPGVIPYLTTPDSFDQAAAEIYQQQLGRIGVRIRIELTSWASWLSRISRRRTVPMGWRGWQADYPDASTFFEPILSTAAISDEGSQNVSFFSHAELDRVLAAAHAEPDHETRMRLYLRAEEIVRDEAPWIPTYTARTLLVWQPWVRGYRPNPVVPLRVRDIRLALAPRGAP